MNASSAVRSAKSWWPSFPRPVWVLQVGGVVNMFGFGLILPLEIIYLHGHRGFSIPVAGFVLSTVMATGALVAGLAGSLVDRVGGKPVLFASSIFLALGYGLMAFVHHPWQGFLFSALAGIGSGAAGSAAPTLIAALTTPDQRVSAFAFTRVVVNLGIGLGAVVGGAIAANGTLWSFQLLYLLDAATFITYGVFTSRVPNARPQSPDAPPATDTVNSAARTGYKVVVHDRPFVALMFANVVFIIVGTILFAYVMPPFARMHAGLGTWAIGLIFFTNTSFIIVVQLPIARYAGSRRRMRTLAWMAAIWAVACLLTLETRAAGTHSMAIAVLAASAILFGIGECLYAVVMGPLVTDLAPPQLVGRYFSVLTLSTAAGFAIGPSLGAVLLAVSPTGLWVSMAVVVLIAGIPLAQLERHLPEAARSRPAGSPPVLEAD